MKIKLSVYEKNALAPYLELDNKIKSYQDVLEMVIANACETKPDLTKYVGLFHHKESHGSDAVRIKMPAKIETIIRNKFDLKDVHGIWRALFMRFSWILNESIVQQSISSYPTKKRVKLEEGGKHVEFMLDEAHYRHLTNSAEKMGVSKLHLSSLFFHILIDAQEQPEKFGVGSNEDGRLYSHPWSYVQPKRSCYGNEYPPSTELEDPEYEEDHNHSNAVDDQGGEFLGYAPNLEDD